jgi:hypothetical protein
MSCPQDVCEAGDFPSSCRELLVQRQLCVPQSLRCCHLSLSKERFTLLSFLSVKLFTRG